MQVRWDHVKFALRELSRARGLQGKRSTFYSLAERYFSSKVHRGQFRPRINGKGEIRPDPRVLIDALRRADEISWVDQYRLNAVV